MKKSILGISIVTMLAILVVAVAFGFGDTGTKFNAFNGSEVNEQVTEKAAQEAQVDTEISETIKGAIQQAQSNVSFRIIEPLYISSDYKFESVEGTKFIGASIDIDTVSFTYRDGNEQLTIREIIVVKNKQKTETYDKPVDTREIIDINGIEGRFSEENGIKLLGWKIGNLSLSVMSWKNEGQNRTSSSLSKEEMIKIAESVREKTPEEAYRRSADKSLF